MNEAEMRKSLIRFINKEMKTNGNTNVSIKNIRLNQHPEWDAFVDK